MENKPLFAHPQSFNSTTEFQSYEDRLRRMNDNRLMAERRSVIRTSKLLRARGKTRGTPWQRAQTKIKAVQAEIESRSKRLEKEPSIS